MKIIRILVIMTQRIPSKMCQHDCFWSSTISLHPHTNKHTPRDTQTPTHTDTHTPTHTHTHTQTHTDTHTHTHTLTQWVPSEVCVHDGSGSSAGDSLLSWTVGTSPVLDAACWCTSRVGFFFYLFNGKNAIFLHFL